MLPNKHAALAQIILVQTRQHPLDSAVLQAHRKAAFKLQTAVQNLACSENVMVPYSMVRCWSTLGSKAQVKKNSRSVI